MKKVCVVSGASAGIGLGIAEKFEQQGYRVFNLDIQAGPTGEHVQCDMSEYEQVVAAMKKIGEQVSHIDALVSNAGVYFSGNIEQTSEADFDRVMAINVKGAYAFVQQALGLMQSDKPSAIVVMASDQAMIGKRNSFVYNMSKVAMASLARTTALDYADANIRCNAVCPGTIETPLYHKAIDNYCQRSGADKQQVHADEAALQPIGRIGQPQEVAELVYFLCSDQSAFITGSLHAIDGGYTAQ